MHDAAIERHRANDRTYTAQVGVDPELNSTVISLQYEDRENPARSITVGIAPDLGSNGHLDLFVANYITFDAARAPRPGASRYCRYGDIPVPCGPQGFGGGSNL